MNVIRSRFLIGLAAIAGVALGFRRWLSTAAPAAPQPLPYQSKEQSVGVVNCASSLCHGSVRPTRIRTSCRPSTSRGRASTSTRVRTWCCRTRSRSGSRATSASGPAHRPSSASTATRTTSPAAQQRRALQDGGRRVVRGLPRARRQGLDRVARRARAPRTPKNVEAGLYPTWPTRRRGAPVPVVPLRQRRQFVTHRMMGAGHPRMSFELDTFTHDRARALHARQPTGRSASARGTACSVWAIGQAIAVAETDGRARSTRSAATTASSPSSCSSTATRATTR